MINKINLIGFGNVGRLFFNQLNNHGISIKVFGRKKRQIDSVTIHAISDFNVIGKDADLTIVCVKDDAINSVVSNIRIDSPIIHTAGSVDMSIFNSSKVFGVFYPLQTITQNRDINTQEFYFVIEASNSEFENFLCLFCETYFSKNILRLSSQERKKLHLAAVFANNFINHLLFIMNDLLKELNLDYKVLEPLVKETISKSFELTPLNAQTGPAKRGDVEIINRHLEMLKDEHYALIYKNISESIIARYSKS